MAVSRAEERRKIEQQRRKENHDFILNPMQWPRWPLLPVKRNDPTSSRFPDCGVMFAGKTTSFQFTVYEGVSPFESRDNIRTYAEFLAQATKVHQYKSIEELLDAGWEVD